MLNIDISNRLNSYMIELLYNKSTPIDEKTSQQTTSGLELDNDHKHLHNNNNNNNYNQIAQNFLKVIRRKTNTIRKLNKSS